MELISILLNLDKDFYSFPLDYFLKILSLWPPLILICIFKFKNEIIRLINRISEIKFKFKDLSVILLSKDIPNESKILLTKYYTETRSDSVGFMCRGTRKTSAITGDGSLYQVPFEKCDLDATNSIFTATQSGIYSLGWYLLFEGVTDQELAIIEIDSSNENFKFRYPNLNCLKSTDGNVVLHGNISIHMDLADTVKLKIQIGINKNLKTISLSPSNVSFFNGCLIKPE